MNEDSKTITVLLVDDDEADREAVERSFEEQKIANPLQTACDGVEALALLRGEQKPGVKKPYVVLLDLNMPRMNGIEFLKELRADPALNSTIVFVLTTSDEERDKAAAYEYNVAGYVVKASAGTDFVKLLTMLENYWRIVEFPPN